MRIFFLLLSGFLVGCNMTPEGNNVRSADLQSEPAAPAENKTKTMSFIVGEFDLRLVTDEGRCVLEYSRRGANNWTQAETGMEGPCDFIGRKIKVDPPQRYLVKKKGLTVLIAAGGPPNPKSKDEFMPAGCGTRTARIRVFGDRVEVEKASEPNPSSVLWPDSYCPSDVLDDVDFAT